MSEVSQQLPAGQRRRTAVHCVVGETGGGKESVPSKDVENYSEITIFAWGSGHTFCCERSRVKRFRVLADEEKQAGIQGQWQQESPAREYLVQVKCCHDTDCNDSVMMKGFTQKR